MKLADQMLQPLLELDLQVSWILEWLESNMYQLHQIAVLGRRSTITKGVGALNSWEGCTIDSGIGTLLEELITLFAHFESLFANSLKY